MTVVLIWMVSLTVGASVAAAQEGNGPYAPFPAGPRGSEVTRYYEALGVDLPLRRIEAGVYSDDLRRPVATGAASRRGGIGDGHAGVLALALVALAGAGLTVAVARR